MTNIQDTVIDSTAISWFPTEPALFVSTKKGIEILFIKVFHNLKSCLHLQSLNPIQHSLSESGEVTIFPPLPSYYSIKRVETKLKDSEKFSSCVYMKALASKNSSKSEAIVVAIDSKAQKLGVWRVLMKEQLKDGIPEFESELLLSKEFDYNVNVTSADCEATIPFIQGTL